MVGILVLLIISWALLHFIEKKSILALGFTPVGSRLLSFLIAFLTIAILCAGVQLLDAQLHSQQFVLNPNFNFNLLLSGAFFDFKSVVTEELVFRGTLLYILLSKIKDRYALLISGVAFGIYHWFSFGIFGQIVPMIIILITIGFTGYAWAWAFKKSGSILIPIGLHLGWNFCFNTIFSKGPLGEILFTSSNLGSNGEGQSFVSFLLQMTLLPIFSLVYAKYFLKDPSS